MATFMLADVITKVADGIATYLMVDVIATCDRWNSHIFFDMADVVAIVADRIATWLECVQVDVIALVADGIANGSILIHDSYFIQYVFTISGTLSPGVVIMVVINLADFNQFFKNNVLLIFYTEGISRPFDPVEVNRSGVLT